MATSPNYSWPEPDNTDLVKNGALAMRTLGNAIDTTMATMTPKSTVTAKGSLIAATAASTPANLAVGNNGETLVADSSTSTGLRYQGSQVAGKNIVINGNFDIWQRGTSFTTSGYFADRWTNIGDFSGVTASQQTTGASNGSRYFLRLTSTANSSYWSSYQFIETAQVETLQGNTATVSVKLRRNATFNANAQIFVQKSATVDAGSGATWTTIGSTFTAANASIPTGTTSADWYTLSGSVSIPNDGTANSLRVIINYASAVPTGSILEISQVQLELGSVATTFTRAGGTIQQELAACQRYYHRFTGGGSSDSLIGSGLGFSTTVAMFVWHLGTTMRIAPSSMDLSNQGIYRPTNATAYSGGTWSLNQAFDNSVRVIYTHGSAIFTAGESLIPSSTSATNFIGFSAEL